MQKEENSFPPPHPPVKKGNLFQEIFSRLVLKEKTQVQK